MNELESKITEYQDLFKDIKGLEDSNKQLSRRISELEAIVKPQQQMQYNPQVSQYGYNMQQDQNMYNIGFK